MSLAAGMSGATAVSSLALALGGCMGEENESKLRELAVFLESSKG